MDHSGLTLFTMCCTCTCAAARNSFPQMHDDAFSDSLEPQMQLTERHGGGQESDISLSETTTRVV